jgi:hypothetical protein
VTVFCAQKKKSSWPETSKGQAISCCHSPTQDAPARPTGPSTSSQHVSKVADAPEKNAGPSDRPAKSAKKVSFSGKMVQMDAGAGEASKWKKKSEALFHLDNLQEEASNHVSSAMAAFV